MMVGVRLWLTKKKVTLFSIKQWCYEIYVKSIMMAAFAIPLLFILNCLEIGQKLLRFLLFGSVSFIWMVFVISLVGLTANERLYVVKKMMRS